MADDEPAVGYSMTGVPVTESKWHMPKLPWWAWTLIVLAVLMVIGAVVPKSSSSDPVITQNYRVWRAECEARATEAVAATDGLYVQGGNHWVSLVNSCLMTKANDAP